MRREGPARLSRYFFILSSILVVSGVVLFLQDDILRMHREADASDWLRMASSFPKTFKEEVIQRLIGGFESDEEEIEDIDEYEDSLSIEQELVKFDLPDTTDSTEPVSSAEDSDRSGAEIPPSIEDSSSPLLQKAPSAKRPSRPPTPPRPEGEKYIVVFQVMDQLTKSSMAVREIIYLAKQLNRTLVLPRVGSSTMGLQRYYHLHPFEFYFNSDPIKAYINTIEFDEWWPNHQTNCGVSVRFRSSKYYRMRCSQATGPHTLTLFDLTLKFSQGACIESDATHIRSVLPYLHQFDEAETLAFIGYGANHIRNISSKVDAPQLQFSDAIHSQVDFWVKNHLKGEPFLAIHWRTETIASETLHLCAHAIADYAQHIMSNRNLTSVYLATDLGSEQKSITLRDYAKKFDIYETVMEELGDPVSYERDDNMFNTHGDSGILSIIEKLICTRADYFLGLQGVCAKRSSFTRQIVDIRASLGKESEYEWDMDLKTLVSQYSEKPIEHAVEGNGKSDPGQQTAADKEEDEKAHEEEDTIAYEDDEDNSW